MEKAIEGGYYPLSCPGDEDYVVNDLAKQLYVLDPTFWQSLGKACGWGKAKDYDIRKGEPEYSDWVIYSWGWYFHRFIDHLAEGKDAESFFSELLSK
ncbi:MAG: hypothetical protein V4481_05150 [Patescibacteria group bacterium]